MATTLFSYTPVIIEGPNGTDYRPRIVIDPETAPGEATISLQDVVTLDGQRYVAVPEGVQVEVPDEIAETWSQVTVTPELRETIKRESRACKVIQEAFTEALRTKYTVDDELYFSRISIGNLLGSYEFQPGELEQIQEYQVFVEAERVKVDEKYAALGL